MSNTWIRVVYAVLLGAALALTVGFGVATFITEPRPPQPTGITFQTLSDQNATAAQSTRQAKQIDSFYSDDLAFRAHYPNYQRNLFLAYAGIGMLLGLIGVVLPAVVNYLRLGFMAGGLLLIAAGTYIAVQPVPAGVPPAASLLALLGYGQPAVLDAAGRFLRFAVSVVGLFVLVFAGLWRLTEWAGSSRAAAVPAPAGTPVAAVAPAQPAPAAAPAGQSLRWARPDEPEPATASWTPAATPPPAAPAAEPVGPVASPPAAEAPPVPEVATVPEQRPDLPDHSETPR